MKELNVDNARFKQFGETGIFVRAKNSAGTWGAFDIADLDRDSLHEWLRSRGGENLWAENTVMILLGHPQVDATTPSASAVR